MKNSKVKNLLNFFSDIEKSDKAAVEKYLASSGVNVNKSNTKIRGLIKKHEARLEILKGKELSRKTGNNYSEIIESISEDNTTIESKNVEEYECN